MATSWERNFRGIYRGSFEQKPKNAVVQFNDLGQEALSSTLTEIDVLADSNKCWALMRGAGDDGNKKTEAAGPRSSARSAKNQRDHFRDEESPSTHILCIRGKLRSAFSSAHRSGRNEQRGNSGRGWSRPTNALVIDFEEREDCLLIAPAVRQALLGALRIPPHPRLPPKKTLL